MEAGPMRTLQKYGRGASMHSVRLLASQPIADIRQLSKLGYQPVTKQILIQTKPIME